MTKREKIERIKPVLDAIVGDDCFNASPPLWGPIVSLLKSIGVDIKKLASLAPCKFGSVEETVWIDFTGSWHKPYPECSDQEMAKCKNAWLDRAEQAMSD